MTFDVTFASPVTTGNLVVVAIATFDQTIPSNAITDNKGNTYTKVTKAGKALTVWPSSTPRT